MMDFTKMEKGKKIKVKNPHQIQRALRDGGFRCTGPGVWERNGLTVTKFGSSAGQFIQIDGEETPTKWAAYLD